MFTKLKMSLLFAAMLFAATGFYSCSNDDTDSVAEAKLAQAQLNAKMAPVAIGHSLTITNNSDYRYAIMALGAQSDYDLYDNLEIFHKMAKPLIVEPRQSVTFYDYQRVSDSKFSIGSWNVIDYAGSTREGMQELGEFSTEKIIHLYGMLSDPNNLSSNRYPVWKWIIGSLTDQAGKTMVPLGGDNLSSSLDYLGNSDQKYNSKIKYGISHSDAEARNVSQPLVSPIAGTPLVIVEWKRSSSLGIRRTGDVNIIIDNYINRI
jgi:hypothetical protein